MKTKEVIATQIIEAVIFWLVVMFALALIFTVKK